MTFNKFGINVSFGNGMLIVGIAKVGAIYVYGRTNKIDSYVKGRSIGVIVGLRNTGTIELDVATRKVSNAEYFGSTVLTGRYGTEFTIDATRRYPATLKVATKRLCRTFRKFGKSAA